MNVVSNNFLLLVCLGQICLITERCMYSNNLSDTVSKNQLVSLSLTGCVWIISAFFFMSEFKYCDLPVYVAARSFPIVHSQI